jgi:hypothetical protein
MRGVRHEVSTSALDTEIRKKLHERMEKNEIRFKNSTKRTMGRL